MKKLVLFFILFVGSALAQTAAVQSGVPVKLEAINGKVIKVFLQSFNNGKLTFQPFKSTKNITIGLDKVVRLEFIGKYDEKAARAAFNNADYAEVLSIIKPVIEPYIIYMPIKNNMQSAYSMMLKSQYGIGDYARARKSAEGLMVHQENQKLLQQGKIYKALSALKSGEIAVAEELSADIESEAGKLYLRASILRAQGKPELAKDEVNIIISEHGNDVEWIAPSELLNAYNYLDMGLTNSAISTAGMVKTMYTGTNISGDAAQFLATLTTDEAGEINADAETTEGAEMTDATEQAETEE